MDERWLPIVGYEDYYEVSDLGRVRSLTRSVSVGDGRVRPAYGRVLRPGFRHYEVVVLSREGKTRSRDVHRLVALAFVANPHHLPAVNHIDLNRRNNRALNLEWVTPSENTQHALRHGRLNALTNPRCAPKLTAEDVGDMRRRFEAGEECRSIAARYGVSTSLCYNIRNGLVWTMPPSPDEPPEQSSRPPGSSSSP